MVPSDWQAIKELMASPEMRAVSYEALALIMVMEGGDSDMTHYMNLIKKDKKKYVRVWRQNGLS